MPRGDFRFAGHAIRVEASNEPLAWLHEFVTPHFAARDADVPDRTIVLTVDAREHARLARQGAHPERLTRACFTLDSGIVGGRVWDVPGPAEVVFDEELGTFYRRSRDADAGVEVIAARDGAHTRLALLRAVREYAMLYATRAGWLILHAAAVSVADVAFVIAGPKRAGKTTLLLHALHNERATYVANDRVALSAGPSGLTAHGLPTIVSIRRESAAWFPGLAGRFERAGHHYGRRAVERNDDRTVPAAAPPPTWGLSPAQLCAVVKAPAQATARVAAVLFPRLGAPVASVTFEALDADQALDAWRGTLLHACPADGVFTIGPGAAVAPEGGADLAARLAALVPSFACHLGPDAYGDGARWLSSSGLSLSSRATPRPSP